MSEDPQQRYKPHGVYKPVIDVLLPAEYPPAWTDESQDDERALTKAEEQPLGGLEVPADVAAEQLAMRPSLRSSREASDADRSDDFQDTLNPVELADDERNPRRSRWSRTR
jgi:hypothetical protein